MTIKRKTLYNSSVSSVAPALKNEASHPIALKEALKTTLKHNVARLVGTGKFAADGLLGMGSSPIMIVVSILYLVARVVLIAFGTTSSAKKNIKKKNIFKEFLEKTIPDFVRYNPIETAAFLGTIAALGFFLHGVLYAQPAMVFTGIAALSGETIIWLFPYLYRDRNLDQAFITAQSTTSRGFGRKMLTAIKNLQYQPVRLGSYLIALSSVSVLINGVITQTPTHIIAGLLYIVTNLAQGLWVDKNTIGQDDREDGRNTV